MTIWDEWSPELFSALALPEPPQELLPAVFNVTLSENDNKNEYIP